jgi:hypothetical protein
MFTKKFVNLLFVTALFFTDVVSQTCSSNGCVTFSVVAGTGCAWMCNYCASQLGSNNYYFTDGVCSYQEGQGCIGNPIAGKTYTCCMV